MSRRFFARSALLATLACAPNGGLIPSDPPFVTGTVTSIGRVPEGWTVRVEERPQDVSGSAKGVFRVGDRTQVRRAAGGTVRADNLREGQRVRVWVTGPVMESYPVQAAARLIVIDGESP
ncbi:MAG: DUF3221 domain-containing protein [Gemmatimonadaceae bacterium]